ncbi:MAG: cation diffusion facilitator family transporter [Myxococcota bacterium]
MDAQSALGWSLALNLGFLAVEVGVGVWTGSLALQSDAAHMVSDVSALALALGAARVARQRFAGGTYGLGRAEVLGAFVNAVALLAVCGWLVWEAVERLATTAPVVPGVPVLVVGGIGLAINLGSAWVLYRSDPDDLNVRGALLHMLGDALGSVAAMLAAVGLLLGYSVADPIASVVVAGMVAVGAARLVRDAGRILLELPPPGVDVLAVRAALSAIDGVTEVHDLHVWSVDGRQTLVSAHLVVAETHPSEGTCLRAHEVLDGLGMAHATVQIERGTRCAVRCEAAHG